MIAVNRARALEIPLSQGQNALVSPEDYHRVSAFKWYANWQYHCFYAIRRSTKEEREDGWGEKISMHRFILGAKPGTLVDHADRDGLNNTRENIRLATAADNARNIRKPNHGVTSGYIGVSWSRNSRKFEAAIRVNGKKKHLGTYENEEDAAIQRDLAALRLHGAFASLNFPERSKKILLALQTQIPPSQANPPGPIPGRPTLCLTNAKGASR